MQKETKKLNSVQQEDLPDNSEHEKSNLVHTYFNSVEIASLSKANKKDKAMVSLKVAGKYLKMKADTGAKATVIPFKLYKELTKKPLQKIHQPLKGWLAVKAINPKGCVRLPTQYKGKEINLLFLVVDGDFTALLSCDACLDLEILKFMNLELISGEVCEEELFDGNFEGTPNACGLETVKSDPVLKDYQDCCSYKPGKLTSEVHLEVDPSVSPVIHPPRKIPVALLDPVKAKLHEMEEDGIIVREESHTPWVSSMVVVDKRKGENKNDDSPTAREVRISLDPRDLNKALKRPHYPMVTIEEVATRLSGAQLFTSLDACSGFWQLPLDIESSRLLTFNTPWGRYRFTRLPFGIAPAPEIYQREMVRLFQGLPVEIIMDDFLIHGNTNHIDQKVRLILDRSREIGVPEVSYAGHLLTAQGLKPDPAKVKAISGMPSPTDKDGVLRVVGTMNYLDKFIEQKADLQEPITQLTQRNVEFIWDQQQQTAFDKLKSLITNAPVLAYFDNQKPTILNVDASGVGLGAVVMQADQPVAYGSRTLTACERRYANIERELLAILWGTQKFHTYLYGRRVTVKTDHKPLETIFKKSLNEAPPRLQNAIEAYKI